MNIVLFTALQPCGFAGPLNANLSVTVCATGEQDRSLASTVMTEPGGAGDLRRLCR